MSEIECRVYEERCRGLYCVVSEIESRVCEERCRSLHSVVSEIKKGCQVESLKTDVGVCLVRHMKWTVEPVKKFRRLCSLVS